MEMRFLSTKVHGAIDYIVGLALILAPMIFGFQNIGGAAVYVPIILGASLIIYGLLTRYEWGVFKLISMYYHMVLDVVVAVLLILSPFLFGFINETPNAWLPHVLVGIAFVVIVLFSKTEAYDKTVVS
jgi:hypothetical protein